MSKHSWRPKDEKTGEGVRVLAYKNCARCRKKFWANHPNAKWCPECRKYKAVEKHEVKCEYCGEVFDAKMPNARFCPGSRCRIAAYRAKATLKVLTFHPSHMSIKT